LFIKIYRNFHACEQTRIAYTDKIFCIENSKCLPKLVLTYCTPLAGLIQDHMISGTSLTMRGRFFNRYLR
jgi:hypothetical protein